MAMPKKGRRRLVIGDRRFLVSVGGGQHSDTGDVPIQLAAQLEPNGPSTLVVKGITTRNYWLDYPETEKFEKGVVTVTPKSMVRIIEHCIAEGWNPDGTGQFDVKLDNKRLKELLELERDRPV